MQVLSLVVLSVVMGAVMVDATSPFFSSGGVINSNNYNVSSTGYDTNQGLKSVWQVNGHVAKPMTFWSWETQDAISLGIYRDQMAEVTASEIVGLLSSSGELLTGFLSADGF